MNCHTECFKSQNGIFQCWNAGQYQHEEGQKKFVLQPGFLAWGPFLGFFWPEGGRRPSEGQKNPKNGPKAKKSWLKHKTIFLSFRMVINVLHWTLNGIFFTNRTSFLLEKVSFLVQKFPIGWKEFLFGFARNKKKSRADENSSYE